MYLFVGNLTINNSTDRFILKANDEKVQNALLTIENVSLDDRGEYKCIAQNAATEYADMEAAKDVSYVRVKGKFFNINCNIICLYLILFDPVWLYYNIVFHC